MAQSSSSAINLGISRFLVGALLLGAPAAHAQIEAQPGMRDVEKQQEPEEPPRLTKPPRLVHQVPVIYPESAKAERRQGAVTLRITIDEEGYVQRVDILQSAGVDLDYAAMGAVANFVFEPAEVNGVPAPIQLDYRQTFVLKEEVRKVVVAPPPAPAPEGIPAPAPAPVEEEEKLVNFRGLVREAGTKRPIADAEIAVELGDGNVEVVATGKDGRFEMAGVPPGQKLIRISATGYEQMTTVEEFSEDEAVEAIFFLPRRSYNKFETVVRDRKPAKEVQRVVLRREEVSQVAGTFGDPLRAIENLPGMARAPLLGGQLLVRGASPESSGVYMDGVQVPLLYHFGGLTSVVNPEFLETIDFYPGGFGAKYGRATAGIVDVKSRNLRFDQYRGYAEVDLFDSGFFFGGPVTLWGDPVDSDAPNPRRVTFAAAGRRSYIDAIIPFALSIFLPPGAGALTVAPVYWDYQAKLEYRPLSAHTFSLFTFGSDDYLRVIAAGGQDAGQFGLSAHTQFHRIVGKWDYRIHPRLTNSFQVFAGMNDLTAGFGGGAFSLGIGNVERVFGARNELRYQLLDVLALTLGADYQTTQTELEATLPDFGAFLSGPIALAPEFPRVVGRPSAVFSTIATTKEDSVSVNAAPYVEAEMGPILGLKIIAGFRLDYYKYGQFTRRLQPTPRIALRWEPIKDTVLKAAYGVYEQAPQQFSVSPTFGQPKLWPERARHYVVGFEHRLARRLTVAGNAFFNDREEMVVSSSRFTTNNGVVELERSSNEGIGRAYGADFMLRHELSKQFFGWIAYTLSRSESKERPGEEWQLFEYDQTHILTIVGQYKVPWHLPFREWANTGKLPKGWLWSPAWSILAGDWSIGGRFRLVSGNPTAFYEGVYHDLDTDEYEATQRPGGSDRMPTFHQLDIRIDYKMAFQNWLVNLYCDLINVYNQKNAEQISWDYRYRNAVPLSVLPFLPIFGVSAEF
ncbi:MAG: TonB-dependent receptor [Myxococcota bacterium]